jgi:hypothetical protein
MISMFVPVKSARFNSFRNGESWAWAANEQREANRIPSMNLIVSSHFEKLCGLTDDALSPRREVQLKADRFCDAPAVPRSLAFLDGTLPF